MKNLFKTLPAPALLSGLGALCCLLRWLLLAVGVDEKGLLISGMLPEILLWILTAAAAGYTVLDVRNKNSGGANLLAPIVGEGVLAVGVALSCLSGLGGSLLEMVRFLLGLVTAALLLYGAWCRKQEKKPHFSGYVCLCAWFALSMVGSYRPWSESPQLQLYFFDMWAAVLLTLHAYYHAACAVGFPNRRARRFTGLLAIFACLAALPGSAHVLLYLAGGIWAFAGLFVPESDLRENTL